MTPATDIILKNDLRELSRLAEALESFAATHGVPDAALLAVNLALEELVTNTISYGFSDDGAHLITIVLRLEDADLHIRIEDDAAPFNPLEQDAPDLDAAIEDRAVGGLGIHLVRATMDDVRYERTNGRNIVSLRKRVRGSAS